jgi:hypothetical protein
MYFYEVRYLLLLGTGKIVLKEVKLKFWKVLDYKLPKKELIKAILLSKKSL